MGGFGGPGLYLSDQSQAAPAGGGGAMGGLAVPLIGAGASIAGGLMGKHSANQAQKAQERANQDALNFQKQQYEDQKREKDYANAQAAATRQRNMVLGNALLRSMGASGLTDPTVDYAAFSAAPPRLSGPGPTAQPAPFGGPPAPTAPRLTLADLVGGPQRGPMPPPAAPMASAQPGTLGTLFRPPVRY